MILQANTVRMLFFSIAILGLYSCSATFYKGTERMNQNNTVRIRCSEPDFQVEYKDRKTSTTLEVISTGDGSYKVVTPSPSSNPSLRVVKMNYEDVPIYLNREMRPRALMLDVLMAIPTIGLSLIVDPFKPTFYAISSKTKSYEVELRYTAKYMNAEYVKIQGSSNHKDFEKYMERFPYSDQYRMALDSRDSIIVNTAVKNRDEAGLFRFVQEYALSKFYKYANDERMILERSRLRYESIAMSKAPNDFRVFMNEFPGCLEFEAAKKRFYHVSCDSIIGVTEFSPKWFFLEKNKRELDQIQTDKSTGSAMGQTLTDRLMEHLYSSYQIAIQQANTSDDLTLIKDDLTNRLKLVPSAYNKKFNELLAKSADEYSTTVLKEFGTANFVSSDDLISFYSTKCKTVNADYLGSLYQVLDGKLSSILMAEYSQNVTYESLATIIQTFGSELLNGKLKATFESWNQAMYGQFSSELVSQKQSQDIQRSLIKSYRDRYPLFFDEVQAGFRLNRWLSVKKLDARVWDELSISNDFIQEYNKYMSDVDNSTGYSLIKGNTSGKMEHEIYANNAKIGVCRIAGPDGSNPDFYVLLDSKGRNITDEYTAFMMKFGNICHDNTMYDMCAEVLENFYSEMEHFTEAQKKQIEDVIKLSRDLYKLNLSDIREKENSLSTHSNKCIGGKRLYGAGLETFNFILGKMTGMSISTHDYQDLQYANCENGRITNYSGGSSGSSGTEHAHRTSYYGPRCNVMHNCPFCKGTGTISTTVSKREEEKQKTLRELSAFFSQWSKSHADYEDLMNRFEQAFMNYKY
jgi:hypothetical protein